MDNKVIYDKDSIQTLEFNDAVRKRIGMYLGSADMQGVYNGIQEIISNSLDEFYEGYGKIIGVTLYEHENGVQTIEITDNGRGVPFGIKEDGSNTLVDIFSRPHTGGKFDAKIYKTSAGLNGIGAKATALSSTSFTVTSIRGGEKATAEFREGDLVSYKQEKFSGKITGTEIVFQPSPEVFNIEPIKIDFNVLANKTKMLSYLAKGVVFNLRHYDKDVNLIRNERYTTTAGIVDLVKDMNTEPIHSKVFYAEVTQGTDKLEVAFQWGRGLEKGLTFTNGLENSEGGTSLTGVRTAITRLAKKHLDGGLTGGLARTGLVYVVNATISNPSFANQTKTKVNNAHLNGMAQQATTLAFEEMVKHGDFHAISEYLVRERKAEQAAEAARARVLKLEKDIEAKTEEPSMLITKLSDAEVTGLGATLYIAEGQSAGGAIKKARNSKTDGVLEVKGKMINPYTSSREDVLKNEEVYTLLSALGITPGKYDPNKLRYGRIALAVDADSDGGHVALLAMSNLAVLVPEFLKEGRLSWLKAPLYSIKKGKNFTFYFTKEAMEEAGVQNSNSLKRYKGLGSLSDDAAKQGLFGKNQRLDVIGFEEEQDFTTLQELMGSDIAPRRTFIETEIDFSTISE